MSGRRELLLGLLEFREPIPALRAALAPFGWDSALELVRFDAATAQRVLTRYLAEELSAEQIEAWTD